ncbi:MAG TPA: sugar phosphate isomerase/epimerase family protein [Alphaproteobacteria bacterium]|nr:sugar phosphate isomerase/epimerase family protein [Alphaproteobacteria bacterium]
MSAQFATNTVTFGGSLADKLQATRHAGFAGIELWAEDLESFPGGPREAAKLIADSGLEIYDLQVLRDFEAQAEARRAEARAQAGHYFDLMEMIGAKTLLTCAAVREDSLNDPSRAADDLAELGDLAHRRGLGIGFEALAWSRWTNTIDAAWRLVRAANRANVGLVVDTFHIQALNTPLQRLAEIPIERVALVQIADAHIVPGLPTIEIARHHRVFPSEGDLAVAELVRLLRESGYAGRWSLEIFNDGYRSEPPNVVARRAMQSLELLFAKTAPRLAEAL